MICAKKNKAFVYIWPYLDISLSHTQAKELYIKDEKKIKNALLKIEKLKAVNKKRLK